MITSKSWVALQNLLVYLLGAEEYNIAVDNDYNISDDFGLYNPNILPKLQAGLQALVDDDRAQYDKTFIIQNKFHPEGWWNNDSGWGSCQSATVFTSLERVGLDAPIDGVWIPEADLRKEIDRLIGEVELWMSPEMR